MKAAATKAISEELKSFAKLNGASITGYASTESELFKEYRGDIQAILPDAISVVVFGVALNRDAIASSNIRAAQYDSTNAYSALDKLAFEIVNFLRNRQFKAVAVPPFLPLEMSPEKKGLRGDISHKSAAVAAGLGTIGLNALLITPEFGPYIRLGSVVTDAVLEYSQPLKDVCDQCELCIKSCPQQALSRQGIDLRKCTRGTLEYGLPGVIKFALKVHDADEEEARKLISSPALWNIWQTFITGSFYSCFECMKACPVGTSERKL